MNKKANVLIIVEGNTLEPDFFKRLFHQFSIKYNVYKLETNIYLLFKKMKFYDFNANIKDVLLEIHPDQKKVLKKDFLYTYLIFDCDPQHHEPNEVETIDVLSKKNLQKLKKMISFFVDETDPTIGKLYVNYPMMESFRDADSFFEEKYKDEFVCLDDVKKFKAISGSKKLASIHFDKIKKQHFASLILLNIYKLHFLYNGIWEKPNYEKYLIESNGSNVLDKQSSLVEAERKLAVLNTSLFIVADYYGNRDNFYDDVLKPYNK